MMLDKGTRSWGKEGLVCCRHFFCLQTLRRPQNFQRCYDGTEHLKVHNLCGSQEPLWQGSGEESTIFSGKQVAITSYGSFLDFFKGDINSTILPVTTWAFTLKPPPASFFLLALNTSSVSLISSQGSSAFTWAKSHHWLKLYSCYRE